MVACSTRGGFQGTKGQRARQNTEGQAAGRTRQDNQKEGKKSTEGYSKIGAGVETIMMEVRVETIVETVGSEHVSEHTTAGWRRRNPRVGVMIGDRSKGACPGHETSSGRERVGSMRFDRNWGAGDARVGRADVIGVAIRGRMPCHGMPRCLSAAPRFMCSRIQLDKYGLIGNLTTNGQSAHCT